MAWQFSAGRHKEEADTEMYRHVQRCEIQSFPSLAVAIAS